MKGLVSVLVVGSLLVAIPGQAGTTRQRTLDDCVVYCRDDDDYEECLMRCAAPLIACIDCCHLKLPNATKEHCLKSCEKSSTSYRCPSK